MCIRDRYKVVGVKIEVRTPSGSYVHETALMEGDDISGVFHTLAINLPDLPPEAAKTLQKAADNAYKAAKSPDEMSTLRWYTRSVINKFLTAQTDYEGKLEKGLKVSAGRTDTERCVVVTVKRRDAQSPLMTSVDLLQPFNQIHRGSEDAVKAFNLMSGLYMSVLEGAALPGDKYSFMDIWAQCPQGTKVYMSTRDDRSNDIEYMKQQGYPEFLIERIEDSDKVFFMPNQPANINGQNRWAWLEIDPETFETISVLDTGEHGGAAEYFIENLSPNGEDYREFTVGAFIGIDVSVWSVASFTLELEDPEQIMEAAKAATYKICEILDGIMNNVGYAKGEVELGKVKLKLGTHEYDYMAKYFEAVKGGNPKADLGQNIINFKQGFQAGAAYYFKEMEKSMDKDDD
ncbi:MAG: hypothetical protein N2376_12920, partial [Clostridia bacterium]|nr:hypothetical protein [Clostridia bacterium]